MISPKITRPGASDVEGIQSRSYVGFYSDADLFGALPRVIGSGTNFQSDVLFVQGYNTFQVWANISGPGQLTLSYGVCHPITFAVLAYRVLAGPVAVSASMLMTFGSFGQSAVAFQGDLFTAFTLRLAATGGAITVNSAVLWCGVR